MQMALQLLVLPAYRSTRVVLGACLAGLETGLTLLKVNASADTFVFVTGAPMEYASIHCGLQLHTAARKWQCAEAPLGGPRPIRGQ